MPCAAANASPAASARLLITAATRAGHCSACAARTTASMLLPRPEIRMTMFFIGRIVPARAGRTKKSAVFAATQQNTGSAVGGVLAPVSRLKKAERRTYWQLNAGLLEGVKDPERHLFFGPEIGRVAEHVEQRLARFLVEFLGVRQLLEHHQEAGVRQAALPCCACRGGRVEHGLGQRRAQPVEILAYAFRKLERFCDDA